MALLRLREEVMSRFRPMLQAHGLTEQQWRVIRVLAEADAVDVTRLAERTSILAPSLSRILRTLEERELVERQQDGRDGRISWLKATGKSLALIENIRPDAEAIYRDIELCAGEQEVQRLLRLLIEMTDKLHAQKQK